MNRKRRQFRHWRRRTGFHSGVRPEGRLRGDMRKSLAIERIQILAPQALLTATPSGDVLELRPSGSWTAANVAILETLSDAVMPQLDRSKSVKLDLAAVRELDTLGAWLLEKMSRRASSAGHHAEMVGVADNHAGLIEEVRQVNRRNPAPKPAANPVLAGISDVGRSAIGATEDLTVFLQMLGSLFVAAFATLRRPRSLRLTS